MSNLSTFFGAGGGGAGGALGGTMRAFTSNCTITVPSTVCAIAYGVMGGGGKGQACPAGCKTGGGGGFSWYEETGITLPAPVSTPVVVGAPDTGSGAGTSCVTFPCQTICATGGNLNARGCGFGGIINTRGGAGRVTDNSGGSGAGGLFGDGGCGGRSTTGGGGGFGSGGGGGGGGGSVSDHLCNAEGGGGGSPGWGINGGSGLTGAGGGTCFRDTSREDGIHGTPGFITGFVGGNFSASKTLWGASGGGGGGNATAQGYGGAGGSGGGGGVSIGPNTQAAGGGGFGGGGGAANNHTIAGKGGCGGGSGNGCNGCASGGGGFVTVEFWETSS